MDGVFDNPSNCAFWFKKFAEEHKTHRDPVCFRLAIFAAVCSYWCTQYNLHINPRVGARHSQDCAIFLRLRYRLSREIRLLELMCLTNFLVRPHNLFGTESLKQDDTRRGPAQAFMNNERRLREAAAELAQRELHEEKRWISHLTGTHVVSVAPTWVSSPSPPSVRSPQALPTRSQPVSPPVFRASSPVGVRPRIASVPRSQLGVAKTAVLRLVAKGISIQDDPSPSPSGSSVQTNHVSKGKGPMSEPEPKKLKKL